MHYLERRERLRELLAKRSLDALVVFTPSNRYYLSGFELHDVQATESAGCLVIQRSGSDLLLTDSRYLDAAKQLWLENNIRLYSGNMARDIAKILKGCGSRIGIETNYISASFAKALGSELNLESANNLVEQLRLYKDADERAALKRSFALNHEVMTWVKDQLVEGMSEKELSWKIECYFREHGASELAFPSIVAFGSNAALPHAIPTDRKLTPDTCVLLDLGCRVDDYCSDQTRTFWFGEHANKEFDSTYELVYEAQHTVIDKMHPGMLMKDAYTLAYEVFKEAGQEKFFTHGLGHGVGLDTHEKPSLNPRATGRLEPGMTVTVEPGLYYPQWGGVRLEYTMLVEEDKVSIL